MVSIPSNPVDIESAFAQAETFFRTKNTAELGRAFNVLMQISNVSDAQREMRKKYLALLSEHSQNKKAKPPATVVHAPPPIPVKPRLRPDHAAKQAAPPRIGLELRAAKREARELALIKTADIPPEDLLPESLSISDPKANPIVSACKDLVAADTSDIDAILACIPGLAQACLKYSPDPFIAKSILFAFCIRRDLSDDDREKISARLSILLETDDRDLSNADTDEMIEPDDAELGTVEEVPVDEDFSDLLDEEK